VGEASSSSFHPRRPPRIIVVIGNDEHVG
jgi:hypothetical protein